VADGAGLSWLHRHTEVMGQAVRADGRLRVTVRADPANADRVRARFPDHQPPDMRPNSPAH
jgi:GTPase